MRLCRSDLEADAADTVTVPCHGECLRSKCSFIPGRGAGHLNLWGSPVNCTGATIDPILSFMKFRTLFCVAGCCGQERAFLISRYNSLRNFPPLHVVSFSAPVICPGHWGLFVEAPFVRFLCGGCLIGLPGTLFRDHTCLSSAASLDGMTPEPLRK